MLSARWVLDMGKWLKRWKVDGYFNMAPKDIFKDTFQMDLLQAYQAKHQSKGVDDNLPIIIHISIPHARNHS